VTRPWDDHVERTALRENIRDFALALNLGDVGIDTLVEAHQLLRVVGQLAGELATQADCLLDNLNEGVE